jgi:hypothetical protein
MDATALGFDGARVQVELETMGPDGEWQKVDQTNATIDKGQLKAALKLPNVTP